MVEYYRNQYERKSFGGQFIIDTDGLVFIAYAKRKLEKGGPHIGECDRCRGMDAARVAEHIHYDAQEKTGQQQAIPVSVYRIQQDKQYVGIRIEIAGKLHLVEYRNLRGKQQQESDNIGQYGTIHSAWFLFGAG